MDTWKERWNERYKNEVYAYGEEPNLYLKEHLKDITPGKILFPAEGEGRNATYAATLGWKVSAFDISEEGRKKAMALSEKFNVHLDYQVGELLSLAYQPQEFDALALIYAHFPAAVKEELHLELIKLIKPNGWVIFEAFSKNHLEYRKQNEQVGGPPDIESLFSKEEIQNYFSGFKFLTLSESIIELQEGACHNGTGSVIRFVAQKLA